MFCAPSLHGESFGVVLLESMAAGTPVVASRLPGYSLVARDGEAALLVEPDDPAALAAGIGDVLEHPRLAAQLVQAGTERVDEFSMTRLAERYVAIYEDVARRPPATAAPARRLRLWRRLLD